MYIVSVQYSYLVLGVQGYVLIIYRELDIFSLKIEMYIYKQLRIQFLGVFYLYNQLVFGSFFV